MKKFLLIPLAVILISGLIFSGCAKETTTPAPAPAPAPKAGEPVTGGIMKIIRGSFPKVLGYPPEFSPTESIFALL
jgi:hypothetical protein